MTVAARSRVAALLPSGFRLREAPRPRRASPHGEGCARDRAHSIRGPLGASLFDRALEAIRPGVRETEVAAEMEYAARKAGAEAMSFETIIASGERSALPHGRASQAAIPAQGFVVCDFGVILSGYCSDMTRTVYVGRPSAEARRVYQAVKQAQQAAVDAVKPGISVGEVDQAARKSLQESGLAKYFTHSTGHGVGLEIHEAPRLAGGQTEILQPGMVITIEPGVYVPGKWGVRIEDMVVVTERGCEVLTPTSKELVIDLRRLPRRTPRGVSAVYCAFPAGAPRRQKSVPPYDESAHTMNQKELKELIEFLIEKDIAEFELERGDVKVRIKRGG